MYGGGVETLCVERLMCEMDRGLLSESEKG